PTPVMRLCGVADTPRQRLQVAATLARQGRLLDAVLSPGCRDGGLRAGLPRLLRDGACPGPRCLELMLLARRTQVPERLSVLEARASSLARWLWTQPAATQRDFLFQAAEIPSERINALLLMREGQWPSLHALTTPALTALQNAWLDEARREHPSLSPFINMLRDLQRRAPTSPATFRAWTASVPCPQLQDVHGLPLSTAQLRAIADTQPRCPQDTVQVLHRYLAKVPPTELIDVLKPLSATQLGTLSGKLGLHEPARAEALFDWVMDRQPGLLDGLIATPAIVAKLLTPSHADRLGGREAVLDLLLGRGSMSRPHIAVTPETLTLVAKEALLGDTPPLAWVGYIANDRRIRLEDKQALLGNTLHSADPRLQAAAAGGLARQQHALIPAAAARACVAELRTLRECMASRAEVLGPPAPGARSAMIHSDVTTDPPPPPPSPRELYCQRYEKLRSYCPTACADANLDEDASMKRLIEAAGEAPPPEPEAQRACRRWPF
ncbi:hypothetical protein, partial [Corallococcus soli]